MEMDALIFKCIRSLILKSALFSIHQKSVVLYYNKEENVHRFSSSAIREKLLERDSFGINTGYLLSIVKIKRERATKKLKSIHTSL